MGGKADRGALQRAFQVSVAGLFFVILVFWISPALSNYGMMNLFLFAELFAFGYWAAALGGQNIHAGAVMFFIIATVGLDAEKPVGVQTVFNFVLWRRVANIYRCHRWPPVLARASGG